MVAVINRMWLEMLKHTHTHLYIYIYIYIHISIWLPFVDLRFVIEAGGYLECRFVYSRSIIPPSWTYAERFATPGLFPVIVFDTSGETRRFNPPSPPSPSGAKINDGPSVALLSFKTSESLICSVIEVDIKFRWYWVGFPLPFPPLIQCRLFTVY